MIIPSLSLYAQVGINSDNSSPDASAMLDIKASDKGMLIPRMTASERDLIPEPAAGLLVYVLEERQFYQYNGEEWRAIGGDQSSLTESLTAPGVACDLDSLASLALGTNPRAIAVKGDYAYVTESAGTSKLKVVDLSNPLQLSSIGEANLGNDPRGISLQGNYAYVIHTGSDDLRIVDISTPSSPTVLGAIGLGSFPRSIAVQGDYAYIADLTDADFRIIDVSDPANPSLTGGLFTPSPFTSPIALAISGDYAYLLDQGASDMKVIDTSNPAIPTVATTFAFPSPPVAIDIRGNLAYITLSGVTDQLQIIDINNPLSPNLLGSLAIPETPGAIQVLGNFAYIFDALDEGLKIVDVSNPIAPVQSNSFHYGPGVVAFRAAGSFVYLLDTDEDALTVIGAEVGCNVLLGVNPANGELVDLTQGAIPEQFKSVDLEQVSATGVAGLVDPLWDHNETSLVKVVGDYAYIAGFWYDGYDDFFFPFEKGYLRIMDIGDPLSPDTVSIIEFSGIPWSMDIDANHCYIGSKFTSSGADSCFLSIINVSNPNIPVLESRTIRSGYPLAIEAAGNNLFSLENGNGNADSLYVIDVSNPASPLEIGKLNYFGLDLALSGNYLYVAGGSLGIVDISIPSAPSLVGSVTGPGVDALSVSVSGNYAYVINRTEFADDHMNTIDVSNPSNPVITSGQDFAVRPTLLTIDSNYAYLADDARNQISIVDIQDPDTLILLGTYELSPNLDPASLDVQGNYIFSVLREGQSLLIVQVGPPTSSTFDYLMALNAEDGKLYPYYNYWSNNGADLFSTNPGNVGIGTNNPEQLLQVGEPGDYSSAVANAWNIFSDQRLKSNLRLIEEPLTKLEQLHGYSYNWRSTAMDTSRQIGVIAQEVELVFPEVVNTNAAGIKSVDYAKLTAFLIEVNKAQQAQIEALSIANKSTIEKLEALQNTLDQLMSSGER